MYSPHTLPKSSDRAIQTGWKLELIMAYLLDCDLFNRYPNSINTCHLPFTPYFRNRPVINLNQHLMLLSQVDYSPLSLFLSLSHTHTHTIRPMPFMSPLKSHERHLRRARNTRLLDQELCRLFGITPIGQMSHDIGTVLTDWVAFGTELLDMAAGELSD